MQGGGGGGGQRQCHPLYKKGVRLRYVEARACTLVVVVVRRITEVGLLLFIHGVHPADIVGSLCEKSGNSPSSPHEGALPCLNTKLQLLFILILITLEENWIM